MTFPLPFKPATAILILSLAPITLADDLVLAIIGTLPKPAKVDVLMNWRRELESIFMIY